MCYPNKRFFLREDYGGLLDLLITPTIGKAWTIGLVVMEGWGENIRLSRF